MEMEAHLLDAPEEWNLQPLPCRNCYGFFFMTVAMENIAPHKFALRAAALATLLVNCGIQLTLLYFIGIKIIGEERELEEDPEKRRLMGFILFACLFVFFVAMINSAKNGWIQSATLTFSGGEEWGGEPPRGRRYARLAAHKKVAIVVFAVLTECILWMAQLYVGVRFLASCTAYIDLVMNSVALIFVSDVDEMIYEVMVPTLIKNNWDTCLVVDAFHQMNSDKSDGQILGASRFQDWVFRIELFVSLPLILGAAAVTSYFAEEIMPAANLGAAS